MALFISLVNLFVNVSSATRCKKFFCCSGVPSGTVTSTFELIFNSVVPPPPGRETNDPGGRVVFGIPLVSQFNLFDQYPGRNIPKGEFYVIDTTEKEKSISRENMGVIMELAYIREDELDTI